MRWKGRRQSDNIEQGGAPRKTIGIGGLILGLIVCWIFGINPQTMLNMVNGYNSDSASTSSDIKNTNQTEETAFVATILADTEDVWTSIFAANHMQYVAPKLHLFSGSVQSACGSADSASGPFYCPADQKVYLDTTFFRDMRSQLGISGEHNHSELSRKDQAGDFAMAYVIAHEIGHHVQNLLGINDKARQAQSKLNKAGVNAISVRLELQADCFAGIWANKNQERTQFLDQGDIDEALDAAEKIGDDYLQQSQQGHVVPDSFTHGTSAQRQKWFYKGFKTGDIQQCDTFAAAEL